MLATRAAAEHFDIITTPVLLQLLLNTVMDLHTGRSLSSQYLKVMATSFLLCGSAGGGKHYVG